MKELRPGASRALFLSTTALTISFALWGLIAALAPTFTQIYGLSAKYRSLMIAIPIVLGSIGRIPAGILTDRFGGRKVFSALLLLLAFLAAGIGLSSTFGQLICLGTLLGIAGTSFAIGVSFTSRWFTNDQQGTALGLFALGNIGLSVSVFAAPVLAISLQSWRPVFFIFAMLTAAWALIFYLFARDAAPSTRPRTFAEDLSPLRRSRLAWVLSLFYFLTFGGFLAFAIYLPSLLLDRFHLSVADAGFRTAGFVVLATLMRPVGGMLSDRFGGSRVLLPVFISIAALATLMASGSMPIFTVGALGTAAGLGLGNGAVFKLVPRHFPKDTGAVTGMVGAFGGLGGFFPPLVLGVIRDATGSYVVGFILLSASALLCLAVNYVVFIRPGHERSVRPLRVQSAQ
jgi:NNP family nitrate/nitrite transporter-like MFS transporter